MISQVSQLLLKVFDSVFLLCEILEVIKKKKQGKLGEERKFDVFEIACDILFIFFKH